MKPIFIFIIVICLCIFIFIIIPLILPIFIKCHCINGICKKNKAIGLYLTSYSCECESGWKGKKCEEQICTSSSCGINQDCVGGSCVCKIGFTGEQCTTISDCTGKCVNGICTSGICVCNKGYNGVNCETKIDCSQIRCGEHGSCNVDTGKCRCDAHYQGDHCEKKLFDCTDMTCNNHGKCNPEYGVCICDDGYSGTKCDNITCSTINCKNGSCLSTTDGLGYCSCNKDWYGENCEKHWYDLIESGTNYNINFLYNSVKYFPMFLVNYIMATTVSTYNLQFSFISNSNEPIIFTDNESQLLSMKIANFCFGIDKKNPPYFTKLGPCEQNVKLIKIKNGADFKIKIKVDDKYLGLRQFSSAVIFIAVSTIEEAVSFQIDNI